MADMIFLMFIIYFWERDRVKAEEGQREMETQNLKQAPRSNLSVLVAVALDYVLNTWQINPSFCGSFLGRIWEALCMYVLIESLSLYDYFRLMDY